MYCSPDEALAMAYIYIHKYERFTKSLDSQNMLDSYVCLPLGLSFSFRSMQVHPRHYTKTISHM